MYDFPGQNGQRGKSFQTMTRGGGEDRRTLSGYDPPTNGRATGSENADDGFTAAAAIAGGDPKMLEYRIKFCL